MRASGFKEEHDCGLLHQFRGGIGLAIRGLRGELRKWLALTSFLETGVGGNGRDDEGKGDEFLHVFKRVTETYAVPELKEALARSEGRDPERIWRRNTRLVAPTGDQERVCRRNFFGNGFERQGKAREFGEDCRKGDRSSFKSGFNLLGLLIGTKALLKVDFARLRGGNLDLDLRATSATTIGRCFTTHHRLHRSRRTMLTGHRFWESRPNSSEPDHAREQELENHSDSQRLPGEGAVDDSHEELEFTKVQLDSPTEPSGEFFSTFELNRTLSSVFSLSECSHGRVNPG